MKMNEHLLYLPTWINQLLEYILSSVLEVEGQEKNWTQAFAIGILSPVMDPDQELIVTAQCVHISSVPWDL